MTDPAHRPLLNLVELFYPEPPEIDREAVQAELNLHRPRSVLFGDQGLSFAHITPTSADGVDAPLLTTHFGEHAVTDADRRNADFSQSWEEVDHAALLRKSTRMITFAEMLAHLFDPRHRAQSLRAVVDAVCAVAPPLLVHWVNSDMWVTPSGMVNPYDGIVNVRLFTVADSDGDLLMDTIGLEPLGLPDLQIHFRDLEPRAIAGVLSALGEYLIDNGILIGDGDTVSGPAGDERWRCEYTGSLVLPDRDVITVIPSVEHQG